MSDDFEHLLSADADRALLLRFLAAAIHDITIVARAYYDPPRAEPLKAANETIHALAGHLLNLCDPSFTPTQNQSDALRDDVRRLPAPIRDFLAAQGYRS